MELIGYPNNDYKFDELKLGSPQAMQGGGAYFAKIMQGTEQAIIQFPRCTTKSGIVSTRRSTYLDLMYDREVNIEVVSWSEMLVKIVTKLIDEKKALWFSNDLTTDDIENMFNNIHRDYKSGTKILIRAGIETLRGSNELKCKVYDEAEKIVLNRSVVDNKILRGIIPLVAIDGVKFTARSIEIELKVKQMMLMDEDSSTSPTCMIKRGTKMIDIKSLATEDQEESIDEDSLVNPASVETDIAIAEPNLTSSSDEQIVIEEVNLEADDNLEQGDNLEEVNVGIDEVDEDLSENVSNVDTHTSTAISESHKIEDGLEEVTLGDLSDFPEPNENVAKSAMEEVNVELNGGTEAMKLKKPNEVYYEIYKNAKIKAKQMRKAAVEAYLEAKQIKTKYMLDDLDESDEDEVDIENIST